MAPGTANGSALANGRAGSTHAKGSHASGSSVPAAHSPPSEQPPFKKRRLKLSVRNPRSNDNSPSDTIAVSRPKRDVKVRYSQDVFMTDDDELEVDSAKPAKTASPAPSSGLSSLSSAPPSPAREESPFKDPEPPLTGNEDYGDFMSYYIAPGDDDALQEQPKSKAKSRVKAKPRTSKVEPAKQPKDAKQPAPPSKAAPAAPLTAPPPAKDQAPDRVFPQPPSSVQQQPHRRQNPPPRPHQNVPPPYPPGPPQPMQRPPPQIVQQPMPQPPPQPVIQFIDVAHDPKPTKPDTIADMINKLQGTSSALTKFGGVPAVPTTPPPQSAKKLAPAVDNPLDGFLSLFGGDDDESEEKSEGKPEENDLDYVQSSPGAPDSPLGYGIQFIQNALKSWAQQRMTHQITQQLQAQHQQMLHDQHMNQQRRGPGRPRKFDDPLPGQPGGPPPVIQMNLADTPEGLAIKSFQSILDSGCLQVNTVLPSEFTRALRHLYMQIDHLINQGVKSNDNWQCMSYGAQVSAHRVRVEKWREAQARAQEEMARQQAINRQQIMAQMGMDPSAHMTDEQLQHAHALELERRRSMQHAAQQPYISQQHLNPLQLGTQAPRGSGTPNGVGLSPSPALSGDGPNLAAAQAVLPSHDEAMSGTPNEYTQNGAQVNSGMGTQVQLDKMKLYMPGFLPRSGQSMKFSFAPHNEAAVRAFGPEAFPPDQPQGHQLPNRGPMRTPTASNGVVQPLTNIAMPDAQPTMIDLTSDGPESQPAPGPSPRPKTSNGVTGGFTAVNKPAPASAVERPAAVPVRSPVETSPETIKVSQKRSSRTASSAASSSKANGMASKFPHAGAEAPSCWTGK